MENNSPGQVHPRLVAFCCLRATRQGVLSLNQAVEAGIPLPAVAVCWFFQPLIYTRRTTKSCRGGYTTHCSGRLLVICTKRRAMTRRVNTADRLWCMWLHLVLSIRNTRNRPPTLLVQGLVNISVGRIYTDLWHELYHVGC